MALGGHQQRNPVPVGSRPSVSVGGGLHAFRLKRPELAILPPLVAPPTATEGGKGGVAVARRRRVSDSSAVMSNDKPEILKVISSNSLSNATAADRVHQLERTIVFLQEKHQELLAGLHAEVKTLKDKNRDLVYKLTLKQEGWVDSRPGTGSGLQEVRPGSASRSSIAQIKSLEAQLTEAQTKLGEVVSRNQYLSNLLLDMRKHLKEEDLPGSASGRRIRTQDSLTSNIGVGISSLHSNLKLNSTSGNMIPIEEAETIIRALELKNEDYRLEIVRLRAELMNALSDNEKLTHEEDENTRWMKVDIRVPAHRTSRHSRDYHFPRIHGSGSVDSGTRGKHN